ncbi:hypothetical protein F2Q70_00006128 [Brassica cretica]|uniref:Uncharacterized protein n=1 Tax=Brassica cretica TaxID=69181 RepID=A0A8S9IRU1_BRACR|nr:hypothetical protein F2Q70_00006128 [Brassica cretica]
MKDAEKTSKFYCKWWFSFDKPGLETNATLLPLFMIFQKEVIADWLLSLKKTTIFIVLRFLSPRVCFTPAFCVAFFVFCNGRSTATSKELKVELLLLLQPKSIAKSMVFAPDFASIVRSAEFHNVYEEEDPFIVASGYSGRG